MLRAHAVEILSLCSLPLPAVRVFATTLQLLVQGLAEQLVRLPVRFDDTDVPLWADSAADYKDAVGQFRSQVSNLTCYTMS
jgi:hypothetical protein